MQRAVSLIAAFALGTAATFAPDVKAQQQPGQATMQVAAPTQLLADDLAGVEGWEVLARRLALPGGWASAKHYHPGHVLLYVLEGSLSIEEEGRPSVTWTAGELVHEKPDVTFVASNASETETLTVLVIDIKAKDQPAMVEVP